MTWLAVPAVLVAADVALVTLAAGILLAVVRLAKGPTLSDRVIAVDLIGTLGVGMLSILAIRYRQPALLHPAMVLALVAFLGTVAVAHYIEERAGR